MAGGSRRPKNVWHSLRKLENHLNRAHIQSGIFLNQLGALREDISFEIRKEIVQKLVGSVNGDLLHALCERVGQLEQGAGRNDLAGNAIILGLHDVLMDELRVSPFHKEGERLSIRSTSMKEYDFETYPETSESEDSGSLAIEVLSCGWKVDGKVVVKPKVNQQDIAELARA